MRETISEMARAFYVCNGNPPNELHASQATIDYISSRLREDMQPHLYNALTQHSLVLLKLTTELGVISFVADNEIKPGVFYLFESK